MLYRYLGSHAYDTLRDRRFMISCPSKFNDSADCVAKVVGVPDEEFVKRRYGKDFGFIGVASQSGYGADAILAVLNSSNVSAVTSEQFANAAEKTFLDKDLLDRNLRVLCLCDADGYPETDLRMWRRYAGFSGVRIGLEFCYDSQKDPFACMRVRYEDEQAVIDLSTEDGFVRTFDIRRIVTTKTRQWEPEREVRLVTRPEHCQTVGSLQFLPFNPEIVRQVDIGFKMRSCESKGLVKMLRARYPHVAINRMTYDSFWRRVEYTKV